MHADWMRFISRFIGRDMTREVERVLLSVPEWKRDIIVSAHSALMDAVLGAIDMAHNDSMQTFLAAQATLTRPGCYFVMYCNDVFLIDVCPV